jgi:transglutaminase-like putative cysteine protease
MPELDTTFWVDETGQILKSRTAFLGGMETYRTTQAAALASNGDFDLRAATILRTPRRLPNPTETRSVVYRLTYSGDDLADVFPDDQRQTLRKASGNQASTLVVTTDGPARGNATAPPAPDHLSPNPLVNSDDPRVIAHARTAVGTRTDPWDQAVAIQDWVFNNLKKKNFGTAFASAKEVASTLEGDCSEHGVLVAAMCRAVGIPCRVVVGLVYADELGGFGPHMWNEVYVNNRWVAIDAAFNQSAVDATHLKLSASSLDGVAPFEAFLPVTRVFNQLQIDPVEIR